jgi:hypothetical protein
MCKTSFVYISRIKRLIIVLIHLGYQLLHGFKDFPFEILHDWISNTFNGRKSCKLETKPETNDCFLIMMNLAGILIDELENRRCRSLAA